MENDTTQDVTQFLYKHQVTISSDENVLDKGDRWVWVEISEYANLSDVLTDEFIRDIHSVFDPLEWEVMDHGEGYTVSLLMSRGEDENDEETEDARGGHNASGYTHVSDEERARMRQLYEDKEWSIERVAGATGRAPATVWRHLVDMDVTMRPKGQKGTNF